MATDNIPTNELYYHKITSTCTCTCDGMMAVCVVGQIGNHACNHWRNESILERERERERRAGWGKEGNEGDETQVHEEEEETTSGRKLCMQMKTAPNH